MIWCLTNPCLYIYTATLHKYGDCSISHFVHYLRECYVTFIILVYLSTNRYQLHDEMGGTFTRLRIFLFVASQYCVCDGQVPATIYTHNSEKMKPHIDGLVHDCSNSIANALERTGVTAILH